MKKAELIFSVLLVPVDYFMLVLAGVATYTARTRILDTFRPVEFDLNLPFEQYMLLVFAIAGAFIVAYALSGLYSLRTTRSVIEEFFKIIVASSAGLMAVIVYIFLQQELFDSRFLVFGAWIFAIVFVSMGRYVMRKLQKLLVGRFGIGAHRVMIIGQDTVSNEIVKEMQNNKSNGYKVVKQLEHPNVQEIKDATVNREIDEVILADPNYPREHVQEIVDFCHEHHLIFRFVPNLHNTLTSNFAVDTFTGVPLVELKRTRLEGWGQIAKEILDFLGSLFGLILLSPLFLLIALFIKLDSKGPVFYGAKRVSKNRTFTLYKFRSMIKDAEQQRESLQHLNERSDGPLFKIKNDPRITRFGRFLRRTRLDELPQLWNVLKGEISLVGPRPHLPEEIAQYKKHHKKVLAVKAGVTGMAQISGSAELPFEEEVALDTLYIENWSFFQDIKIIIFTILKLFRDRSAV